jgi:hypothetical protein
MVGKTKTMAQLIEPITIMVGNEEKIGCILKVYKLHPFEENNTLKADILDRDGQILFTTILKAANVREVAKQLNLTLLTIKQWHKHQ